MTANFSQTAAYIWSLADLLRGDFKQSQYGRVILPFTILRRLECVLEARKPKVLEQVQKLNPEVVYAYAPGWGSTGPDSQRPGFAPLYSGYVGLHHEASGEGNLPAAPLGNEDNGNGLLGAGGILMARQLKSERD